MSLSRCMLSEEQFRCSICLDVFTDPVTIPCGHNFCGNCITCHWNFDDKCKCPLCAKVFQTRPELQVNTFISGMAAQVKQWALIEARNLLLQKNPCSEEDLLLLIDPAEDCEERICENHGRPVELFPVDHKRKEYEQKKAILEKDKVKILQKIQERQLKIEQIKHSLSFSREEADHLMTNSVQVFKPLVQTVQLSMAQLLDLTEEKQKKTEKQAEGFIKELKKEISDLVKRSAEVEQLLRTEDHLQFLQNFPSLSPAPRTKDWTGVRVHSSHEEAVRSAMIKLEETLSRQIRETCGNIDPKSVQQFAVNVTLDPQTANPYLTLTENKKKVYFGKRQKVPNTAERLTETAFVLGKESFSAGKFYFEVQVKGKQAFELGVALGSINRKKKICPGSQADLWLLSMREGNQYRARSDCSVPLSLKSKPQKVGVFVDYAASLVSFYDADTAALIYSFTDCNFTDKLFPIFGPCTNYSGHNAAPLVITPVSGTLRTGI